MENNRREIITGFTFIETIVSISIFTILILSVYGIYTLIISEVRGYREKTTISALADQYLEIARNLPYSQIGTLSGNPHGNLPDLPNAASFTINGIGYRIYYVVNYVDDPADGTALANTDSAPNDYKQIKVYVENPINGTKKSFATTVAPKGLENLTNGGALSIKVFNAVGQPVSNANIQITNNALNPNINLTRTSDANGNWVEVGLPNSVNGYHVVVTKNGYSTDQSYPIAVKNPNPIKPDATISNGQVTQISFSIDQLSNLTFNTLSQVCDTIPRVSLEVSGSKLIGTPDVLKFDNIYTSNANGQIPLNNIEWDNYTTILTGTTYMIYGSSPIQQTNILPNTNQNFTLMLGPNTKNSLLVVVKDAATGNPIEGANVGLQKISPPDDTNKVTGGSVLSQQDWFGGLGQENFNDSTKYYQDDGNINNGDIPSGLRLANVGGSYVTSGSLTSSTFDTGTTLTSYTVLNWQPTSQDPATDIKFQIAANNDKLTWDYIGPDGTDSTYYTVPGTTISTANNNRYIRYKAFLSTIDASKTPVLTSININYVSGCFTPGQVIFPGLQAGQNYNVVVSKTGYQTKTINNLNINGYNVLQVLINQ